MVRYNSKIPSTFGYEGMVLFGAIFVSHSKEQCPEWLLKHEQVHVEQQEKWWYILYYIVYGFDYLKGLFKYRNHREAYNSIRFEVEAYNIASPQ